MRYNRKQWFVVLVVFLPLFVFEHALSSQSSNSQLAEPEVVQEMKAKKPKPIKVAVCSISNGAKKAISLNRVEKNNNIFLDGEKLTWHTIMSENFESGFPGTRWELLGSPTWDDESYNPYNGSWCGWCAGSSYTPPIFSLST